jgi:hypothetical protein
MPGYSTLSRFSLIDLHSEDRKQRAHLKKISEMQRRSDLDNGEPFRLPYLHQNFLKQLSEKRQEINKENEVKSKKLLNIMGSNNLHLPSTFHPTNKLRRNHTLHSSENNIAYFERIAKVKAKYDAREWRKQYEQHKGYLRLSKDSKVFTPLDIGINRERFGKRNSLMNSKRTTPASSLWNLYFKYDKYDRI